MSIGLLREADKENGGAEDATDPTDAVHLSLFLQEKMKLTLLKKEYTFNKAGERLGLHGKEGTHGVESHMYLLFFFRRDRNIYDFPIIRREFFA